MAQLTAMTPMMTLLKDYPGARRALFAKYHIGGCSSCAYRDDETLKDVCERNEIEVEEAIRHVLDSHAVDAAMLLSVKEVASLLDDGQDFVFLDIRTREEHEAVAIEGSQLMTQELQQFLFSTAKEDAVIVLYDHRGTQVLDTCAWFQGHGLKGTRAMQGGIDAWSQEIDTTVQRYRLELDT